MRKRLQAIENKIKENQKALRQKALKKETKETMVTSWTHLLPASEQAEISHGAGALRDSEIPNWRKDLTNP